MEELIIEVECFNLKYTLECGQCFRWEKSGENEYIGVIHDRVLKVKQIGNKLYIKSSDTKDLEKVVRHYFDLDTDYKKMEEEIIKVDDHVKNAVKNTTGIRILNQDFYEMVISYIISANNNIPRISKSIKEISKAYGTKINFDNEEYYLFPTKNQLANATKESLRKCGVGFRDRYIYETNKMIESTINIEEISKMSTEELKQKLQTMQGIGPKVADCILLFSCSRKEVFPIDVWVERVMQKLYFKDQNKIKKKKEILEYAKHTFKNNAGIIQQHLFYNIRENLIG